MQVATIPRLEIFKLQHIIMKKIIISAITVALLFLSNVGFSQTPNSTLNLGILNSFEAFTGAGGITNSGGTVTGDVGTNLGIISGFASPPYTGNQYNGDAVTNQARYDLLRLYINLNALFVDFPNAFNPVSSPAHGAAFGGGETLVPGIYAIGSAGSLSAALTLDGGGNPNAVFVIKMNGAFTVAAGAKVNLINGAKSSNVFWLIGGAISVAAAADVKGTLFSKAGAVGLAANVILEGRMFSLAGAITMGIGARATPPPLPSTIPIFCEGNCSPAPAVDILGVLSGFALFATSGSVGNTGVSGINGMIGTNAGTITGYTGGVHIGSEQIMNPLTVQAAADLDAAYIALMALTATATHAANFLNETLAPGVYSIPSAGALGGIIILDAANNPNAIFVFRFAGAFNIAAASKIILANGARRCNIFWLGGAGVATGALNIGASSELQGTFIAHGGACNSGGGVFMAGRQLSTLGAVNTDTGVLYNNPECVTSTSLGLPVILAIADTTSSVNGLTGGVTTTSLTSNDKLGGAPVVIGTAQGNVTLTGVTVPSGLTLNTNGTVAIAPNTPLANYSLTYKICEVTNPTNCSSAVSIIVVAAPVAVLSPDLIISLGQPLPVPIVAQTSFIPVTVTNIGLGASVGIVTAVIQIPNAALFGLFPINNNGWTCSTTGTTATCTSATGIAIGGITTFNVPFMPVEKQEENALIILPAVVSGGSELMANAGNNASSLIITPNVASANLSVNFIFSSTVFTVGASKTFIINLTELGNIATNGTVVEIFIPKSVGFTYDFNVLQTSVIVTNLEAVDNLNWSLTTKPTGLLLKSIIIIPANGTSKIAITVTANTAGTLANLIANITPNGGGETNKFNDSATLALSVQN